MKGLNQRGFTLLELLAVLVILAALATIAIPIFTNRGDDARLVALRDNAREIAGAIQRYEFENGQPAAGTDNYFSQLDANNLLVTKGYLSTVPISPITKTNSLYTTTDGVTTATGSAKTTIAQNPVYVIGLDGSTPPRTIVKLVCIGDGTTPITASTGVPAVSDTTSVFAGYGSTNTTIQEVLPTAKDGVTYASIRK